VSTDIAVITGGGRGMGLATAKLLGRDHAIVLADLNEAALEAAVAELDGRGIRAVAARADVTDPGDVARLLETASEIAAETGGRVRAVVHAAGVSPQTGDAAFIYRVNALGTVHVTRAFLRIAQEGDALVNVASIAGHWSPKFLLPTRTFRSALTNPARFAHTIVTASNAMPRKARPGAAYGTSKAFVIWYTEQMAAAFGAKGARIVSVSPGTFDTEMGRLEVASGSDRLLDYAALRRFGKPEEIAAVLAFAAGREPGYLTGVDILVDGGTNAGMKSSDFLAIARG